MRIRTAVVAAALAATAVVGGAGVAAAADPKPPTENSPVGVAENSPGLLSGDVIQVPVDVDANVCGDSIDVIGLLNPASGNTCKIK
ncbi:chaplin [Streptomyces sp. NPDC050485]|uniref:chaplin n=1 Tax=Streptomyces sp. NPDC050485 TaxID=3365617 RepID=UPI0037987001